MNNLIGHIVPADCPYCIMTQPHEIMTLSHHDDVEEYLYPTLRCIVCKRALGHRNLDECALHQLAHNYAFAKRCPDVQITVTDIGGLSVQKDALLAISGQNFTRGLWDSEEVMIIELVNLLQEAIYRLQLVPGGVGQLDIQIRHNQWLMSGHIQVPTRLNLYEAQRHILSIERIGRSLAAGLDNHHSLHFTYAQTFITPTVQQPE